jgi:hypothetical protein
VFRALIVAVILLFGANAVAVATIDDDETVHATGATSSSTSSSTIGLLPATTTTAVPNQIDALVKDLQRFVEARRGLPFTAPVKYELLSASAFRAKVLALAREDDDELEQTQRELVALGLLKRGVDLRKARDKLLGGAVIGLYDPEKKELFVKGQKITPFVRTTLAHEITHALQDQHFNIDHPEYDDRDDEIGLAFGAVAEGDALRIEEAYRNTMTEREQREETAEQIASASGVDFGGIPAVLSQLLLFPYADGPGLIAALVQAGGNPRVDTAFRTPPTTSEQVLHPPTYLAGEGPKPVTPPTPDGTKFDEGVLGEFLTKVMLGTEVDNGVARTAAAGWGGDRYVAWDTGDKTCLRVAWTMDSAKDLDELRDALTRWASKQPDAKVTGTDPLVVTSCA